MARPERRLQPRVREAEAPRRGGRGGVSAIPPTGLGMHDPARQPPPEKRGQGKRAQQHENAEPQESRPPARALVEVAEDGRPHGARDPLPGREHPDRKAAPVLEPAHRVDRQRTDDRRVAEQSHHEAVDDVELPMRRDHAGEHGAGADHHHADPGHRPRAGPVEPVAHHDAPDPGAEEETGVGERGHAARPAEVERDLLESHHEHEHRTVRAQHEVDRHEQHHVAEGRRDARGGMRRRQGGHGGSR